MLVGGLTFSGSLAAQAEKEAAPIAFLGSGAAESSAILLDALKDGLRENGLIERRDYVINARWADGAYERFPAFARELAQGNPRYLGDNNRGGARGSGPYSADSNRYDRPNQPRWCRPHQEPCSARRQYNWCFEHDSGHYHKVSRISPCGRSESFGDRCAL